MGQQIESALRASMHRVVVVLVNFLPGVLAFLLAVIVFAFIGVALAALVRRMLIVLHFDERIASSQAPDSPANIADWSPGRSPTLLAARAVLWLCVLLGVAVGLSALDAAYSATSVVSAFVLPYLTHLTGAVLLLIAGSLLARFLARSVLIGAVNAQLHYARFLALGVKWLVLVLTAAMALDHLGIGGAIVELAFGIMFGGIVLTLSLAIGLGSRDLVSRSLEKTMEKTTDRPFVARVSEPLRAEGEAAAAPKLRHF
jgi:hypothetical protein